MLKQVIRVLRYSIRRKASPSRSKLLVSVHKSQRRATTGSHFAHRLRDDTSGGGVFPFESTGQDRRPLVQSWPENASREIM